MVDLVPQTTHGTNKGKIELYERIIFFVLFLLMKYTSMKYILLTGGNSGGHPSLYLLDTM